MTSLALAHFAGTINLTSMSWLWVVAFVGASLFQMGLKNSDSNTSCCP